MHIRRTYQIIIFFTVCFVLYEQSPIFSSELAKTASYENCIREAEENADICHAKLPITLPKEQIQLGSLACIQQEKKKKKECIKCKSSAYGCF